MPSRAISSLASLASNRSIAVRYRPAALLRMAPWLARYWWNSAPNRLDRLGRAILPLIERCIEEHRRWTEAAGTEALMRGDGWIEPLPHAARLRRGDPGRRRTHSLRPLL
jgi:D-amino-acid dehydrogenase